MAFPTIPTTGNGRLLSQNQNNATSPRTFPSLSSLTKNAGDMLLAIVVAYERGAAGATFSSWGASFTERADIDGGANLPAFGIASKVSDGTETGTFTVAQAGVVGHCSLFLLSIAGGGPLQMEWTTTVATGTGAAADPASLNPANWGTEDTLWIAVAMNGETSTTGSWTGLGTPTAPTNYTSANSPGLGTDAVGGIHSAVAFRQNNTAAEDVGTWTGMDTTQARNAAILIAVRPVLVPTGLGTRIFVGSGSEIWNHTPGVTYEETGLGRTGVRGPVQATGSGTLVASGSASDAVTWTDTGYGLLAAVGSGVAVKQSGATEKAGTGTVSDLKGAASDEATFIESGSATRILTASASDAVTFTESGSATLPRAAAGSDEATFTETGTGILGAVGSGAKEVSGGTIYEVSGRGVMGVAGAITKSGAGIRGHVGAGEDAATFDETGTGILTGVVAGAAQVGGGVTSEKAAIGIMGRRLGGGAAGSGVLGLSGGGVAVEVTGALEKAGTGIRALVGAAADAVVWQKTGKLERYEYSEPPSLDGDYPPSLTAVGSGVAEEVAGSVSYEKAGTGTRGFVGAGADAVTFVESGSGVLLSTGSASDATTFAESGAGILNAVGSGVAVEVSGPLDKSGAGVRGFSAAGSDAVTFIESGAGIAQRAASGADAATFTESGAGILARTGGGVGSREAGYEKSGTATSSHTASGADAVTFTKTVAGVLDRSATGSDTAQFTKRGGGVLDASGSVHKIRMGEFVVTGSATAVFVASGAVETDLDRPPPGIITQTNTGRITRLRVGRITHSREGVLV